MKRHKRTLVPIESLESRMMLSVTPKITELDGTAPLSNGFAITNWPAGIALHLSAVAGVDSSYNPSGGSTYTSGSTPNNTSFQWDFGDTAMATDPDYTSGIRSSRDTMVGFNAAHIYDTPGTYTILLTTKDQTGATASTSVSVQVTNTYSSGSPVSLGASDYNISGTTTNVYYVDSVSGLDTNSGTSQSAPIKTFKEAMTKIATGSPSYVQVRFMRGDTFALNSGDILGGNLHNHFLLFGAYGTGAQPILQNVSLGDMLNAWTDAANWTIQDINLMGTPTSTTAGSGFGLLARGKNFAVRNCTFTSLDSGIYSGGPTVDGLFVEDNVNTTPLVEYVVFTDASTSYSDYVITDNTFTGASETWDTTNGVFKANQPYFRVEGPTGSGRILIEGNTIMPTLANGSSVTLKPFTGSETDDFVYVANNTIGKYDLNVGVIGDQTAYDFAWTVIDGNRLVASYIKLEQDEDHIMIRNNIIERYSTEPSNVESEGIYDGDGYKVTIGATVDGTNDLEVVNNTFYTQMTGNQSGPFLKLGTYNSGVIVANNLMIAPSAVYSGGLSVGYREGLNIQSASQLVEDNNNIWSDPSGAPTGSDSRSYSGTKPVNGEAFSVVIGTTNDSVDTWNAGSRATVDSSLGTGFSGVGGDDLSQAITIADDPSASSTTAWGGITSTSGNPNWGQPFAGANWDFYGNPRPATGSWTVGAVQGTALTLTGTSSGDSFYLREDPTLTSTVDIWQNTPLAGPPTRKVSLQGVSSILINGSNGNEAVTIDGANGALNSGGVLSGGVNFVGGTGTNSVAVVNTKPGGSDTVSAAAGTITVDTTPISYTNTAAVTYTPGSGSNTLAVTGGTLEVPTGAVGGGIRPLTFSSLSVSAVSGAKLLFLNPTSHSDRSVLVVSSLSVSSPGTLDMGGNDMIVHGGSLSTITGLIAVGINGLAWTGTGIDSSAAANDTAGLTALGVMQNSSGGVAIYGSFDGVSVTTTDVLLKYTYYGDANLDGKVDSNDYTLIDNGSTGGLSGWYNGDFNYDGLINGTDYTLIDNAFNNHGPQL